jgi:hypothetical protein
MKEHVFVPFYSCIPWNRRPILFVKLVSHTVFVVGFLTRWQYFRTAPVLLLMMAPIKWIVASLLSTSWCIPNAYPMAGGVPAVAVTGLGMSASMMMQLIMCTMCALSWLLAASRARGGCTYRPRAVHLTTMGWGGGFEIIDYVLNNHSQVW